MDRTLVSRSKRLSWLLRHGAPKEGVAMDAAGWVEIADVLSTLRMSRRTLDEIVRTNNKRRIQVDGTRIRACQGHSHDCDAVTREALEASWRPYPGEGSIWHGTRSAVVGDIAREGIRALGRTHVHLAPTPNSIVGKRAKVGVMLEVSPQRLREAGWEVHEAPNGVVLVRHVPPGCIVGVRALSRRARRELGTMRSVLGLAA